MNLVFDVVKSIGEQVKQANSRISGEYAVL